MKKASLIIVIITYVVLASVMLRFFVRQILVLKMNVRNTFTDVVLFESEDMYLNEGQTNNKRGIVKSNWIEDFPFDESIVEVVKNSNDKSSNSIVDTYNGKINFVKQRIEKYTTDYLMGYRKLVELSREYEKIIGWNYTSISEYNGIIRLEDDYLTDVVEDTKVTEHIKNVVELNDYCNDLGSDFVYVQAPFKVDSAVDNKIAGYLDYSNQNAEKLIDGLRKSGVNYIDLIQEISNENIKHHELFYKTDHHWKTSTGIWATGKIISYLRRELNYDMNDEMYDITYFEEELYPNSFLGSQGTKVSLAWAEPEDFSLFYPKKQDEYIYDIYDTGLHLEGDFSIFYNKSELDEEDVYLKNSYAACSYGDYAYMRMMRKNASQDDKRIVFIHDSFGDCVLPMLTLSAKEVYSIDLRYFTGSIKTFIKSVSPDLVVVLYNPAAIDKVEYEKHNSLFDFR